MEAVNQALDAFRRHRLRTALALSGVIMAVAVTLTSAATSEGARRDARRQTTRLGVNTIVLRDNAARLSTTDAEWLSHLRPYLTAVASVAHLAHAGGAVSGVTPGYALIRDLPLEAGRFINDRDERDAARVCAVGAQLARRLFGPRSAIGGRLRVGRTWFTVVGVVASDGWAADEIFVPFSSLKGRSTTRAPHQPVSEIWVRASTEEPAAAEQAIRDAVASRPSLAGVEIVVARHLLRARDRTERVFTVLTGVTGALLFVLGALAIANVLLTSVLERTAEIGLRRAVGATRRAILRQFLLEAAGLSAAGAGAGLALGAVLAAITARYASWPMVLAGPALLIIPLAAVALGIAAGVYPAFMAARVQPIDALTHE